MRIEILHTADCPNWRDTADLVTRVLTELNASNTLLSFRTLHSPEEAASVLFAGSPTVLIDGVDAFPANEQTAELTCRIYRVGGRIAGVPAADDLRAAISAALRSE